MNFIVTVIVLGVVIVAQLAERYLFAKTMTEQLNKYMIANIAKNSNEYITVAAVDKVKPAQVMPVDEVPLDQADDEVFDRHVKSVIGK